MAWIGNMIQNNNNSRALNDVDVKTAKTIEWRKCYQISGIAI